MCIYVYIFRSVLKQDPNVYQDSRDKARRASTPDILYTEIFAEQLSVTLYRPRQQRSSTTSATKQCVNPKTKPPLKVHCWGRRSSRTSIVKGFPLDRHLQQPLQQCRLLQQQQQAREQGTWNRLCCGRAWMKLLLSSWIIQVLFWHAQMLWFDVQGDEDVLNAVNCRSLSAKEPLFIGFFCGKWPIKIRHPIHLRQPLCMCLLLCSVLLYKHIFLRVCVCVCVRMSVYVCMSVFWLNSSKSWGSLEHHVAGAIIKKILKVQIIVWHAWVGAGSLVSIWWNSL